MEHLANDSPLDLEDLLVWATGGEQRYYKIIEQR